MTIKYINLYPSNKLPPGNHPQGRYVGPYDTEKEAEAYRSDGGVTLMVIWGE